MNEQELEDKIVAQCELRRSQGWKIVQRKTFNGADQECCALGAFGELGEPVTLNLMGKKLGIVFPYTFSMGFDDIDFNEKPEHRELRRPVYDMGRRVARRLGLIEAEVTP